MNAFKAAGRASWVVVALFVPLGLSAHPAGACDVLDRGQVRYFTGFVMASHYCPFRKQPIDAAKLLAILHALKIVSDQDPTQGNCMEILIEERDKALAITERDMDGLCKWAEGELNKYPDTKHFFSELGIF
jgi:hypothetical protein